MYDTYSKIPRSFAKRAGLTKELYLQLRTNGWDVFDSEFASALIYERRPVFGENKLISDYTVLADSVDKALSIDAGKGPYDYNRLYSDPVWQSADGTIRFLRVGIAGDRIYGVLPGAKPFNRKLVDGPRSRYFDVDVLGRQRRVFLEECVPPIGRPLIVPYRKLLDTRNEYAAELRKARRDPQYDCEIVGICAYLEAIEYALAVLRGDGKIGDGAATTGA